MVAMVICTTYYSYRIGNFNGERSARDQIFIYIY